MSSSLPGHGLSSSMVGASRRLAITRLLCWRITPRRLSSSPSPSPLLKSSFSEPSPSSSVALSSSVVCAETCTKLDMSPYSPSPRETCSGHTASHRSVIGLPPNAPVLRTLSQTLSEELLQFLLSVMNSDVSPSLNAV